MEAIVSEDQTEQRRRHEAPSHRPALIRDWAVNSAYLLALAVSISLWFITIRASLWLDETGSYWQISGGLSKIWSRQGINFPAYPYILWFDTRILGTSEVALRIPSILAMLGAVYLLYRAAREIVDRDAAIISAIVFTLHPIIVFTSTDIRPYAFGLLTVNATILVLFRLRHNDSYWMATLFGFLAGAILYFHYLFAALLPALVICFFVVKTGDRKTMWRQFAVAAAAFGLAFLPIIPGLHFLFGTARTYVWENPPTFFDFVSTLAPYWVLPVFAGVGFIAFLVSVASTPRKEATSNSDGGWRFLVCATLAVVPLLILYDVSRWTSIHMFVFFHRSCAVPGIALCWASATNYLLSRRMRFLFSVALVAATTWFCFSSPKAVIRVASPKYALQAADRNAAPDNTPIVICSEFVESNYSEVPLDSPKSNQFFSPLGYYNISAPVVPLPMSLNSQAVRLASQFLQTAEQKHQRFLALGSPRSSMTLAWLSHQASASYDVRTLGVFDGYTVLEFTPLAG